MHKVLFVCTGNICRSPTAEGVMRHRLQAHGLEGAIHVDSAGTHGYHIGESPDRRSVLAAQKRGIRIDQLRARQLAAGDFQEFNLILGLDTGHVRHLKQLFPKGSAAVCDLFLEYSGIGVGKEVADPYYGGPEHFERALDLIENGVDHLIVKLKQELRL